MPGIFDTIKLTGTLILAIPAALAGLEFLLVRGEVFVGLALITLAIVLVLAQHYITSPKNLPKAIAKRLLGDMFTPSDSEER